MRKKTDHSNSIPVRYIVDKFGKKTDVIINIKIYNQLIEILEELYFDTHAKKAVMEETEEEYEEIVGLNS